MTLEQRGAAALALISYPWQATGYTIAFFGPRERLLGFTTGENQRIEIYVRPKQSIAQIAYIIGHELGHAVDFTMTTDAERVAFRQVRGLDDRPWFPACGTCTDFATPAGDWAETFAYWLVRAGPFASQLAPRPSAAELEALSPLFAPSALAPPAVRTSTTRSEATTTPAAPTQPSPTAAPPVRPESAPRPQGLFDTLFGTPERPVRG